MRKRKSHVPPPLRAPLLCLLLLLTIRPGARAESLLPAAAQGGLGIGAERVDELRRVGREAQTRVAEEQPPARKKQLEQVLVLPQRPGKNNVRYYDFQWRRYDYLDDRGVGGVRFYFYPREEEVARTAAALVRDQYEMLAERFNYRPTTRVPYILYNSHREFENTNVFFVNEYILGVTSPLDLRMALPYWGEIERFREVSTHEMTHQFEIQKLSERAAALGMESPIGQIPLWFTEGLAEYYAKNGIDLECDMFARDILLNARPEKGYAVPSFWDDTQANFIFTYKLGQLRVAFLGEQYGERIIQGILDQAPRLGGGRAALAGGDEFDSFQELVARLTGERADAIAQRFSAWLKRRYLPSYLRTRQEPPAIEPLDLQGEPDAFSVGEDGFTILYRTVERDTGRARLFLADRRDKESAEQVASDGVPGLESLHPVLRNVTAVGKGHVAFFARRGQADTLYVQPFSRHQEGSRVFFELGDRKTIDLTGSDIIEAGDPAFSPDGGRVGFFALDTSGKADLWTADVATGKLKRLTNDRYAERDLTWIDEPPGDYGVDEAGGGGDGTIIYSSDATESRKMNLFALDPATGRTARLTSEQHDQRGPYALGGGQIVFSSDAAGKNDLHLYDGTTKTVKQLTDFITQLTSPTPGPRGLMALGFYGGQYKIFDVPTENFLSLAEHPALVTSVAGPAPLPEEPIPADVPLYEPLRRANWRLENGVAALGTSSVGQGALLFGDVFSDRNLILQLAIFGSISLTDALAFYVDRSERQVWGVGLFHTFTQRRDTQPPGFNTEVLYLQREFGLTGLWSYPFDTFSRIEARVIGQGVNRIFQFPLTSDGFRVEEISIPALRTWDADRGGYDIEALASVRYGYDTTRYRFPGGAFGGGSFLLELGSGYLPLRSQVHEWGVLDAQYHQNVFGAVLHLRAAGGVSGGSIFGRQFFLSSFDNLRNYQPGDRRLLGTTYAVTNADFEVPLDKIVRVAFITNVKGVLGADFGGVAQRVSDLWGNRTLAYVLGTNVGLGPFEVRLQWAKPIDIGGVRQLDDWVTNISLRYAYF